MGSSTKIEFYQRRERDQLRLADRAVDPAIARIHRELARRYAAIAAEQLRMPDAQ